MISFLVRNSVVLIFLNEFKRSYLLFKYRKKKIQIFPGSRVSKSKLNMYNKIGEGSTLYEVEMGDFSYIGPKSLVIRTTIGKFTSIGPEFKCGWGMHPTHKFVSTHPAFYSNRKQVLKSFADKTYFKEIDRISIGNDVFIGRNVTIIDGIKIGDGAVVGAGAVVVKDIPPYSIAVGNPAKIIKYRFTDEIISFLLTFKWWNKTEKWFEENYSYFTDIERFYNTFRDDKFGK